MLLKFGSAPATIFAKSKQLPVHFISDRADGLSEGSQVFYRGVGVGRVTHMRRDENQKDVIIDALIDETPPLPANVMGAIRTRSLISGTAELSLELVGDPTTLPSGTLAKDQEIRAKWVGSGLIPESFGELAVELQKTTHDVREARLIAHLDETVRQAGDVMKSLRGFVDDPRLRENITAAIDNFRQVMESANRAAKNVETFSTSIQKVAGDASATLGDARVTIRKTQDNLDRLSQQMTDRIMQVSKLLESFQSIAEKVDKGQGTAGLLVNDPKLYQSLLETSRELTTTISDLRRLVAQWEQEGVSLKMK